MWVITGSIEDALAGLIGIALEDGGHGGAEPLSPSPSLPRQLRVRLRPRHLHNVDLAFDVDAAPPAFVDPSYPRTK